MSARRIRSAIAGTGFAFAAAALASAGLVLAQGDDSLQSAATRAKPKPGLSVRGSTSKLYPGATVSLPLKVKNKSRTPLQVRKLRVKVGNARAGCPGSLLRVQPFKTTAKVRGGQTKKLSVRVTMSTAAPDACQSARFPLTYRVRAARARR